MSELAKLRALVAWLNYASLIASDLALWGKNSDRPFTASGVLLRCEQRIGSCLVGMVLDPLDPTFLIGVRSRS